MDVKSLLNQIYHGDNLYYLEKMQEETIDLIYIDPPFGTQSLFQSKAFKEEVQELKFYDIWGGGVHGYLEFMIERLRHMHKLLKPTGSLFVHLDWRVSHYIKIELDKIFGITNPCSNDTNFINEIIWCYKSGGAGRKRFARKHDTILFYAKDKKHYLEKFKSERNEKSYQGKDYSTGNKNVKLFKDEKECCLGPHTLVYPKDWWTDCNMIATSAKGRSDKSPDKRTGWPTQKPFRLLEKIIETTTKKNDIVVDFFCGCGTAIDVAQTLQRNWIGFDACKTACEVMKERMERRHDLFLEIKQNIVTLDDFKRLCDKDKLAFEKAAVRYIGGVTNHKQVAEGGVDGRLAFDGTPIQVKGEAKPMGDNDRFRGFYEPLKEHGRGVYITLNGYTRPAKERAAKWRREGLDIQLLSIEDVLSGKFREQPLSKEQLLKVAS